MGITSWIEEEESGVVTTNEVFNTTYHKLVGAWADEFTAAVAEVLAVAIRRITLTAVTAGSVVVSYNVTSAAPAPGISSELVVGSVTGGAVFLLLCPVGLLVIIRWRREADPDEEQQQPKESERQGLLNRNWFNLF